MDPSVPPATELRAWKPPVPGIREVFHARFAHAYPRHTHDAWTLFIVDEGAIHYGLDRHERGADMPMVTVLPPHVVHDGRPGTPDGYRKRVLYVETSVLGEGLIGPAVDRPVVGDLALRQRVAALHDALECRDDAFEAEARLHAVADAIRATLRGVAGTWGTTRPDDADAIAPVGALAEELRAFLDARLFDAVTMVEASRWVGASPSRLARAFATTFGIAPHQYLIGRRLDAARDRILAGDDLADVAVATGFVDQAHLTRRFGRQFGMTPGRLAAAGRTEWRSAFRATRSVSAPGPAARRRR